MVEHKVGGISALCPMARLGATATKLRVGSGGARLLIPNSNRRMGNRTVIPNRLACGG